MALWNKKLIDPTPESFGLDISDLSLKMVHIAQKGKRQSVVAIGNSALPRGSVVDGAVYKTEQVAEVLGRMREELGIAIKNVHCSLPETKAFLRIISIPEMTHDEASEAIKWEMEAHIPMKIDQVYYDWQILSPPLRRALGRMDVLVVAVARTVVDQTIETLESAGLSVQGFEVESIAQARSLMAHGDDQTTMIIDIGEHRTSFLVIVRGVPAFTSSIPLSAAMMTDVIAKDLGLSHEEAERVKIEHGIGSVLKNDHIFEAMKPLLQNLISEVQKSINFYLTGLRYTQKIDTIILCGGGAKTKGLVPYLSRSVGQEIQLGDPWVNLDLENLPPIDREESAQYATAIGLAMQSIDHL